MWSCICKYIGNNKIDVIGKKKWKLTILLLDVEDHETNFVLANIYNPNTETQQQEATLIDLGEILETVKDSYDKHIVLDDDSYEGKPTLKKRSIAKFIELKEKIDLCEIWRIRNP